MKTWRDRNVDHVEAMRKKSVYGPDADVGALLEKQGGGCGICGDTEPTTKRPWHIDHDHETGKVRGVLCHHCNVGIGNLRDDPELLRAAIAWLEQGTLA